jgi:hypothetical protein
MAGAKNMQDQVAMIRAGRYGTGGEARGMTGPVRGLGVGFGNGLVPGVPILETIGQTPGIAEQYGGLLANRMAAPVIDETAAATAGNVFTPLLQGAGDIAGLIAGPEAGRMVQNIPEGIAAIPGALAGVIGNFVNNGDLKRIGEETTRGYAERIGGLASGISGPTPEAASTIEDFRVTLEKVGPQFAKAGLAFTTDEGIKNQARIAMKGAGFSDTLAQQYLDAGVVFKNVAGEFATTGEEINQVLAANAQGKAMQTPEFALDSMRRSLIVATNDLNRRAEYARSTEIPTAFAVQYMQAPPPDSKLGPNGFTKPGPQVSGLLPRGNLGGFLTGVPASDIASYQKYRGEITKTRGELNAVYQEGRETLLEKGVKPEAIASVEKLGLEIRNLSDREADITTAYETQQYNRQLFVSKRTLGDIVGLSGQNSSNTADGVVHATRIGILQRTQLVTERESARISLARSKREIEFQIALSRLNTPGATPEEQATKREQAMYLAEEAKRQWVLQKKLTFTGFDLQDAQIARDLKDAAYQIKDAVKGREVTIEIKNIEALKATKQELLSVKTAVLESYKGVVIETDKLYLTAQRDVEAQTGVFAKTFNAEVDARLDDLKTKYGILLATVGIDGSGTTGKKSENGNINQGPNGPGTGITVDSSKTTVRSDQVLVYQLNPPGGNARGIAFTTRGKTEMTVGEAGDEHVVVLRNPRRGSVGDLGGGGGGGVSAPLTVNFNGPVNVRDEMDLDAITARVERALDRRTAMMGLVGRN